MYDHRFTPSHRGGGGPPLLLLHGFLDTWRTWELVLGRLERGHEVFAPTLPGHAGGPPLAPGQGIAELVDATERMLDDAGLQTTHIAGNSLGGHIALQLAARGRARSVVAFAPAGGWARDDASFAELLATQAALHRQLAATAPTAHLATASAGGRRAATRLIAESFEHIPAELLTHQALAAARCSAAPMLERARSECYEIDAERIVCPVRIVWGTDDRLLPWPSAAVRLREEWLPHADWIELEGVGHCPQLDSPLQAAELIRGFITR